MLVDFTKKAFLLKFPCQLQRNVWWWGDRLDMFGTISVGGILAEGNQGSVLSSVAKLSKSAERGRSASLSRAPDEHLPLS